MDTEFDEQGETEEPEHNETEADIDLSRAESQTLLWTSFQNCATSISKVYIERESQRGAEAFKNAARDATLLYKDGVEVSIKLSDMAMNAGYNRRNKEILQWVKKRRRFIRREELIAMLCCPPSSQHQQPSSQGQGQPSRKSPSHTLYEYDDDNKHLDTFREAIQTSNQQDDQSQLTGIQPHTQQPPTTRPQKRSNSPLDVNMELSSSPIHKRFKYF